MVSPADRPSRDGTPYAKNAERPDTQPVVRGVDKEKLIKSLPQWAATYDHSALQKVKEFVFSADTEVRSAAIDAVVAVGIPEGADVLEDALKTITVPEEIVAVKEKIRFLRLPAASR